MRPLPLIGLAVLASACAPGATSLAPIGPVSIERTLQAFDVYLQTAEPEHVMRTPLDISTRVSAEAAAAGDASELDALWARLAPCSDRALNGDRVEVDFGATLGGCDLLGTPVAGIMRLGVSAQEGAVEVLQSWAPLQTESWSAEGDLALSWQDSDLDRLTLRGDVDWQRPGAFEAQHVVVDLDIELLQPLQGLSGLIVLDGVRTSTMSGEHWEFHLDQAEVQHPLRLPRAGHMEVITPEGRSLQVQFTPLPGGIVEAVITGSLAPVVAHIDVAGRITVQ